MSMSRDTGLILILLLVCGLAATLCGCASPPAGPVGRAADLPRLPDIDGNEVFLSSLLQDRVDTEVANGKANSTVHSPAYLVLVNTHSACPYSTEFMDDLVEAWEGFSDAGCRCALVVQEKPGAPLEDWRKYGRPHLTVFADPAGKCLEKYAEKQIPAVTIVDQSGFVVFHFEGYLDPAELLNRILSGDFAHVKTESG
jgi:hypothetical protein